MIVVVIHEEVVRVLEVDPKTGEQKDVSKAFEVRLFPLDVGHESELVMGYHIGWRTPRAEVEAGRS
jgi:hypothetical protein